MFDDIGKKIKAVTVVFFVIGAVASIITGFAFVVNGDAWGIALVFGGPILLWLSSFFSYGLGQLIENSDIIVRNIDLILKNDKKTDTETTLNNGSKTYADQASRETKAYMDKISEINDLRNKGLITEEEYNEKIEKINNEQ